MLVRIITLLLMLSLIGCKTKEVVTSRDKYVSDTLIKHEVKTIELPFRNVTIIESPCKGDSLVNIDQKIENGNTKIEVINEDGKLILNVEDKGETKTETDTESKRTEIENVEKVRIIKEIPKWCWYVIIFAVVSFIYLIYRICRIFYIPLRVLPY